MKECVGDSKGGSEGLTWGQFWPAYLEKHADVRLKPATVELHKHLSKRILSYLGDLPISETTDERLDDFTAFLTKEGLKPRTINMHLHLVCKALRVALRWKKLEGLPFCKPQFLRENYDQHYSLDSDSRSRLLSAASNYRDGTYYDIVLFFLSTGLRRNECKLLQWKSVNPERRCIEIVNTKNGKPRMVPLSPVAFEILKRQIRSVDCSYVFYNPQTRNPWADLSHIIKKILRLAGLSDWRLHCLRHAFASSFAAQGAELFDIMKILGHESPEMSKRYVDVSRERVDLLLSKMSSYLEGPELFSQKKLTSKKEFV